MSSSLRVRKGLLEAEENQLLDDLQNFAGHGLIANGERIFKVKVFSLELVKVPCTR